MGSKILSINVPVKTLEGRNTTQPATLTASIIPLQNKHFHRLLDRLTCVKNKTGILPTKQVLHPTECQGSI